MTVYSPFDLTTPDEEEKLRYVLSVLTVDQLYRLARKVRRLKRVGFGTAAVVVAHKQVLERIQVETSEEDFGE